jgi:peptide-methionine (S)-S-oxide reductase
VKVGSQAVKRGGPSVGRIGFGGGCHWCTEAIFESLRGVQRVQQGFACSHPPAEQYSEAVLVDFDNECLPLEILIDIHLRTHASTSVHAMRLKYRSAIYVSDAAMTDSCLAVLERLQDGFDRPLITEVLELVGFELSPARYHHYYFSDPEKPFCSTYIEPKISLLNQRYRPFLKAKL